LLCYHLFHLLDIGKMQNFFYDVGVISIPVEELNRKQVIQNSWTETEQGVATLSSYECLTPILILFGYFVLIYVTISFRKRKSRRNIPKDN
jgi:hypothetical protein